MGKGEIARYKQFLLFPQCFQKACFPGVSKGVIVWEWVNSLPNNKIFDQCVFKAFAYDKINVYEIFRFVFFKVRKHCGKRRKRWFPAFSPFSYNVFESLLFQGC